MGFHRQGQPQARLRPQVVEVVTEILNLESISTRVMRERDPFNVDDPCPVNPHGHQAIASCGEVVCWHCAKIFWS